MTTALRGDFDAFGLRVLARSSKDAGQARRLLALAVIYEGATRTEAAKIGVAIVRQGLLRCLDSNAEPLHKARHLHCLRKIRVAVVGVTRLAEVLAGDNAIRTAGIDDLDAIIEPGNANWRIRRFVCSVHQGVLGNLLQCGERIVRAATLYGP